MDDIQESNLGKLFDALPKNIKRWLASEELVFIVTEIESKLGISNEKIQIIPQLILRLVVQDIEPQNFINEISEQLGVPFLAAKAIAEDIEKRVLRPIATELRDKTGLEVKLIYYSKPGTYSAGPVGSGQISPAAPTRTSTAPSPMSAAPAPASMPTNAGQMPKLATPPAVPPSIPPAKPVAPAMPRTTQPESAPAMPFILHQENPTTAPSLSRGSASSPAGQAPQAPQNIPMPKTNLTMKVQNYFQSASAPERTVQKPIAIRIETPVSSAGLPAGQAGSPQTATQPAQQIPTAKSPAAQTIAQPSRTIGTTPATPATPAPQSGPTPVRVVHYSDLRTPITNLGLPKKEVDKDNVVDLRKFM